MYISQRKSIFLKTIRSPYVSNTPGCSSKLTPTGVEIDTCASQMGCQLSSAASGMSLGLCYWHNFSGMKRSCRTTGSWWCCLSLGVVSSIPVGSTIIYRFLCGFICVSLCQSIKIKPTKMYIASDRAQFSINTHGCWNWHLCIPGGLSVVQRSLEHVIEIVFLTHFQWHEEIVLDNWQLAVLPQFRGSEFNPCWFLHNLLVTLWDYIHFPMPEHQH